LRYISDFTKMHGVRSRFNNIARTALNSFVILYTLHLSGCAHHPKSSATVIHEGEHNPTIREAPEHAGEIIRNTR
jgi:hypothetical protein